MRYVNKKLLQFKSNLKKIYPTLLVVLQNKIGPNFLSTFQLPVIENLTQIHISQTTYKLCTPPIIP